MNTVITSSEQLLDPLPHICQEKIYTMVCGQGSMRNFMQALFRAEEMFALYREQGLGVSRSVELVLASLQSTIDDGIALDALHTQKPLEVDKHRLFAYIDNASFWDDYHNE